MDDPKRDDGGLELLDSDDDLYSIPMLPVAAEVLLVGRPPLLITLHLATASEFHAGSETLDEFLNSARRFIPAHEGGRALLLNRDAVLWVRVAEDAPVGFGREEHVGASMDLVRVELEDGAVLEGTLRDTAAAPDARLSDVFNHAEQFVPLEVEGGISYVNKRRVAAVRL